jgi:hypothetical protein
MATMKKAICFALITMFCSAGFATAQANGTGTPASKEQVEPSVALDALLSGTEGSMMQLVKAMPADQYNFAPSASIFATSQPVNFSGVRTFGALVIHVAQANYAAGGFLGGSKPSVVPSTLSELKDKDQIVAALAASFAFVHKAISTVTAANAFQSLGGSNTRATLAGRVVVHTSDEYGQMVEYARMVGVVPPASQK